MSGKISHTIRSVTLLIGLLSISLSVFEYRIEDRIEDELETARHQKDMDQEPGQDEGTQIYLPDYLATISSFQLHLENIPSLLGYIPVLISVRNWFQIKHPLTELNFFRTLFQHIIAPNAP
ncbi:MAG: hypothetical protein KFF73_11125 [Cyclobacteriaceae bacterium]|nr:hypothetical protein [Cyclobacteriaceae bacterium]